MTRRLPVWPTLIVAAAVAVMLGLGVWQLQRAAWKGALLDRYAGASSLPPIAWPNMPPSDEALPLFRRASGLCLRPVATRTTSGQNRAGEGGYAFIADCTTGAEGPGMSVAIGWSKNPQARYDWKGGPVSGVVAPDSRTRMRLVADRAPAGLEPLNPPSLDAIPNNHLFYAIQWFFFAAVALLIYALALRGKWAATK